jgi:hypothetical protein
MVDVVRRKRGSKRKEDMATEERSATNSDVSCKRRDTGRAAAGVMENNNLSSS